MLSGLETDELRESLLGVNGVGPETADDILLYAFERPVFVIDASRVACWHAWVCLPVMSPMM